jgi:hypothetical protein
MTAFDWQRTRQRLLPQRAQPFPLADELLWSLSYPVNFLAIGMVPNPGAGISTASAEVLLGRILVKIDDLCAGRDWLKKEQPGHMKGGVLGSRSW